MLLDMLQENKRFLSTFFSTFFFQLFFNVFFPTTGGSAPRDARARHGGGQAPPIAGGRVPRGPGGHPHRAEGGALQEGRRCEEEQQEEGGP